MRDTTLGSIEARAKQVMDLEALALRLENSAPHDKLCYVPEAVDAIRMLIVLLRRMAGVEG